MAPKKLVFVKNGEQEDEQQALNKADEKLSDEESSSDSDSEEEEGTALVPPKKPKFVAAQARLGPEPVEDGSACSSPSASGFIIMPAVKPSGKKKTTPASKVFPNEDVIALLKGLAVFWADGRNNKWTEFHHFIKDDLTNQFSKIQVSEKIRALKKKFEANFERARANGGHLDFLDPHEAIVFELSKAVWGDEKGVAQEIRESAENEDEEANKKLRERKQVDEHGEEKKKKRKRKQVDEHDEKKKMMEQGKEGDEHDEKILKQVDEAKKKPRRRKQVDEHDESKKISEQGKEEDKHDENQEILKQGEQGDEDNEENNTPEKGKQVKAISKEDFQAAYPLLYASFDILGCPKIVKEKCILIPPEKAQELEEKWREFNAEALRFKLRKIDLIKRDLEDHLQRK